MTDKRAPGRPKLPPGKGKQVTITIRVSETERALIDKAAKRSSQKVSKWARQILVDAADR